MNVQCPLPLNDYPTVLMAHGSGGRMMQDLIQKMFIQSFGGTEVSAMHDSAVLELPASHLAFTTDSFTVNPLFFPGGDIGTLAVYGTVNDLAMSGARPLYLSAAFILEEGLPMETLWKIVQSMQQAAETAGVRIATGDTKVVERGKGDGIYINTTGIGALETSSRIHPDNVQPGDAILLSGDIGRHGMAIMAEREGLAFESLITSDCMNLSPSVQALLEAGINVCCLRDATRGGVAAVLNEIAEASGMEMQIDESSIPVSLPVRAACEILGFDPLYVANEGRFVAFIGASDADAALAILNQQTAGISAARIGTVNHGSPGVILHTAIGGQRILNVPAGELLPRIC